MLEVGCGDGANALAIASTLPHAHVVAFDLSVSSIERGRALAAAAGVENLDLRVVDLADVEEIARLGTFDYIAAHGVYSWVPPTLRGALLDCCRRCLAPHGIAFVSYNAYPGSYLRDMARDILEYHLRGTSAAEERLAHAHGLMEAIVAAERPTPYARVLRDHLQRMLAAGDALLYHDDLAAVSTPFYFHEFVEHANRYALQFLTEADLSDSLMRDVPERVAQLIERVPEDVVVREQYLDFFNNRMFRQTLLVHANAPVQRAIDDRHLESLAISSPAQLDGERFVTPEGAVLATPDPVLLAAMSELSACWPSSLSFTELTAQAAQRLERSALTSDELGRLREALLHLYLARLVLLHGCALPVSPRAGEYPQASPLARAQRALGREVLTTLVATNCGLEDPLDGALLPLLDGTRNRVELAAEVDAEPIAIEGVLARLARHGLLCG